MYLLLELLICLTLSVQLAFLYHLGNDSFVSQEADIDYLMLDKRSEKEPTCKCAGPSCTCCVDIYVGISHKQACVILTVSRKDYEINLQFQTDEGVVSKVLTINILNMMYCAPLTTVTYCFYLPKYVWLTEGIHICPELVEKISLFTLAKHKLSCLVYSDGIFAVVCARYTTLKNENAAIEVQLILEQDFLVKFVIRAGIAKRRCAPLYLLSYCLRFAEYGWNESSGYLCPLIDLKVGFLLFKTIATPCLQHSQNSFKISVSNPLCS